MRAPQIAITLFLVLIFLIMAGSYAVFLQALKSPGPLPAEKSVYIRPGSGTRNIAEQLYQENAVAHPLVFALGSKLRQVSGAPLKAGEYLLAPGMSIQEIIILLQSGKTYQRKITLAEGLTSKEIVDIINASPALEGTITDIPAEGKILPETYSYTHGETRQAVLDRMTESMTKTLAQLWEARVDSLPVKTPEEAVTLASVVEKETGVASERPRVAGVFVNRLNKGMPLQSDPTVIYAITLGKYKLERQLYRKDLNIDSPYNTYVVPGLPPGPIANPGRASIEAVLKPEANTYYYFVADGTGGHAFAETLEGHIRNVTKWREIQKKTP